MKIYIESIDNINLLDKDLNLLKKEKLEKINNIKNLNLKKQSFLGELLLIKHLPEYNLKYEDVIIKYNKNNKPYILGNPIYYNIAHSGKYVVLAISRKPIGIDIQEIKEKKYFRSYVSKISGLQASKILMTKLFTLGEAQLKLEGSSIIYFKDTKLKKDYKFTSITYKNYVISICYKV